MKVAKKLWRIKKTGIYVVEDNQGNFYGFSGYPNTLEGESMEDYSSANYLVNNNVATPIAIN